MKNLLTNEPKIRIFPENLLAFFDQRQEDNGFGTHTSAINGIIGEDLVLGLYLDYLEKLPLKNLRLVDYKCTTGRQHGPRLDAWIASDGNLLRQVEVKNWAANAIGGEHVDRQAKSRVVTASAKRIFKRYFTHPKVKDKVLKVFTKMCPPKGYEQFDVTPALAVWSVIGEARTLAPCFHVKNTFRPSPFNKLEIFSASLYLRDLPSRSPLWIYMPRYRRRMELLRSFADVDSRPR